jgi:hypothetical protein
MIVGSIENNISHWKESSRLTNTRKKEEEEKKKKKKKQTRRKFMVPYVVRSLIDGEKKKH